MYQLLGLAAYHSFSHNLDAPGEEDFYRSPDAEMSIIWPTLLLQPNQDDVELMDIPQSSTEYEF